MSFYGSCNCGCGGRHSIDNVSGRPIYVEDYVIPVFKGSTLTAEFQFPFTLTGDHLVTVVSPTAPTLEDGVVTQINENTVSITWASTIIEPFAVGSKNLFRVRVEDVETEEVKVYNEITIRPF